MAIFIDCGPIAHESELQFMHACCSSLPDNWIVFGNPTLMKGKISSEFDAIILSESSLWGVEIKAWAGPIRADAATWYTRHDSRKSPLQSITSKMRTYLCNKADTTLEGWVYARSFVAMMTCRECDFTMKCPGRERVVFFDNLADWLMQDEAQNARRVQKKKSMPGMPPERMLKKFIRSIAGERAWQAYLAGGDNIPDTLDAPGANLVFTLKQKNFVRNYYSNDLSKLCLNKAELRGSDPDTWKNWHAAEGAYIYFTKEGIDIEALPGIALEVNGKLLEAGRQTQLDVKKGNITVGGIPFQYLIEKE